VSYGGISAKNCPNSTNLAQGQSRRRNSLIMNGKKSKKFIPHHFWGIFRDFQDTISNPENPRNPLLYNNKNRNVSFRFISAMVAQGMRSG
jgi:hypothetical protein